MDFAFVRVRKWLTAIGRRTILLFLVILIREVRDFVMVCAQQRTVYHGFYFFAIWMLKP